MKGSKRLTWLLVGAACLVIVLLCAVWGYQRVKKAREPELTAAPSITLSAEEAFDAAAGFHHAHHPELGGYNIFDQRTTPDGGHYNVQFTCGGWEFAYEVDGKSGTVREGETNYDPSAAPAAEPPEPAAKPEEPADEPPAPGAAQAEPENGSGAIDERAALAAALAHAGVDEADLVYQYVELEYDNGRPVCYEVEFGAGDTAYGYEIGLDDGAVLAWEYEQNRVLDAHHPELFHHHHDTQAADIGADAALEAALTHAGLTEDEAWMQRAEPDWDDGYLVYEVTFRAGKVEYEYKVDAASGEILEFEQEEF